MEMITMSLERQIGIVILCYLLSFLSIRWFLWGIKLYMLNTSARKNGKREKRSKSGFYIADIVKKFLGYFLFCILL